MPCRSDGLGTGISPDGRYDDGSGSYDHNLNNNTMPCHDEGYPTSTSTIVRVEDTTKVDKLTQLLCEATQHLNKNGLLNSVSGELLSWTKKHVEEDKKRLRLKTEKTERARLRRSGLSKLSSEEIKALGLTKK